ncbi:MAG: ribonuclease HIII [Verrucomicrobiota bacterium]
MSKNSFTYKLTNEQQESLFQHLQSGNYTSVEVPHTRIAVAGNDYKVNLYNSGKCLIQGKGAEEWVSFVLEPEILKEFTLGYEDVLNPQLTSAHMGVDESGKGDFFGPMVVASAFVDPETVEGLRALDVKDSKRITSDKKALTMARDIRNVLKGRFNVVTIGNRAYNRLYAKMGNVNKILAWGHARTIENLLERVPDCPRAISDQFGPKHQIKNALMKKGKSIELEQMHKAESDPAVAAASILARAGFIDALRKLGQPWELEIPKGASDRVKEVAVNLIGKQGPNILLDTAKCHFKTTDAVLSTAGFSRSDLEEDGQHTSKAYSR